MTISCEDALYYSTKTRKVHFMQRKIIYILLGLSLSLIAHSVMALGINDPVQVSWKGKYYPAHIIQQQDANFRIHYDGYDSSWDEWVSPKRMRIEVLWKGKWYPAKTLETSGSRVRIHYTGYDSSWDEWVTLDRIRSR